MQFGPLIIQFDDRVLRPRPWTLAQATWGIEVAGTAGDGRVLELCAGVGQIGLAMAKGCATQGQPRSVVLVDADPHACELAERNSAGAQLPLPVDVRHGRLETMLQPEERFAVILADPPWVTSELTDDYPEDPLSAIDGGADGLELARSCLNVIGAHLDKGGSSILQLGTPAQVAAISGYVESRPELGLRVNDSRTVAGANGVLVRLSRDENECGPDAVSSTSRPRPNCRPGNSPFLD